MTLNNKQKKALKAEAHHLKPVIRIGQKGLTDNLVQETEQALNTHELLKIHIADDDRDLRRETASQLAQTTGADIVSQIGKTFTLYRKKKTADT